MKRRILKGRCSKVWKKKIAATLSVAFLASSLTFGSTASAYIIDVGMADLAAKEKAEKDKKEAAQKAEQEKIAREKAAREQRAAAEKRAEAQTAQSKNKNDERKQESRKRETQSSLLQDKAVNQTANKADKKTNDDAGKAMAEAASARAPMQDKKAAEPKLPVSEKKTNALEAPVQNTKKDAPKAPVQEKKTEEPHKGSGGLSKTKKGLEKERFQELLRDGSFVYYMDMKSVRYVPIPNRQEKMIDVWVKLKPNSFSDEGYSSSGKYYLEHYYINPKERKIQFLCELEVTGRPSNAIKERPYSSQNWENLVPGSVEDDIYHAVVKQVKSSSGLGGSMAPSASDILDMLNIGL
jgi:hypothetical protein